MPEEQAGSAQKQMALVGIIASRQGKEKENPQRRKKGGVLAAPQPSGGGGRKGPCKKLYFAWVYNSFRSVAHAVHKVDFDKDLQ